MSQNFKIGNLVHPNCPFKLNVYLAQFSEFVPIKETNMCNLKLSSECVTVLTRCILVTAYSQILFTFIDIDSVGESNT